MERAARFLLNRNLAKGWNRWRSVWEETARKLASMRRSLSHLLNRELSRGFVGWVEAAEERREVLRKLRSGVSRMGHRKLAVGFASWLEAFGLQKSQDVAEAAMTRALSYFTNRHLSRGWNGWYALWSETVAAREAMALSAEVHAVDRALPMTEGGGVSANFERLFLGCIEAHFAKLLNVMFLIID